MGNSMTIYMDVLHNSILGEKDEPITVINLLHIKASVLKSFSVQQFHLVEEGTSKTGGIKCALPAVTVLWFLGSLPRDFKPVAACKSLFRPTGTPMKAPMAAGKVVDRASSSVLSSPVRLDLI